MSYLDRLREGLSDALGPERRFRLKQFEALVRDSERAEVANSLDDRMLHTAANRVREMGGY